MFEGLIKRFGNRSTGALRTYQVFLVSFLILFTFIGLTTVYTNTLPTNPGYSPDGWAQMSMTIGASVLTLLAIIISIGLSNENIKRLNFNETLTGLSNKIEEKRRNNPDRTTEKLYYVSLEKLANVLDSIPVIRYRESLLAMISFIFFLLSTVVAIMNLPFYSALFTFVLASIFLIAYVWYVIEEFANMDKYSHPPKIKGSFELLDLKINGVHQPFQVENNRANIISRGTILRLEATFRVSGYVRNGFLHATLRFGDNLVAYIPDSNIFLAGFGFIDNYGLTLLEKDYDTGILQMDNSDNTELDFEIPVRLTLDSEENPLIGSGIVNPLGASGLVVLGNKRIYKNCSIPAALPLKSIELRIYEDPLYRPNFKRRAIDCITLNISEGITQ